MRSSTGHVPDNEQAADVYCAAAAGMDTGSAGDI